MGLLVGFETLSKAKLKAVRKGFNSPDTYLDVIHKIHDFGIGLSGAFLFGLDGDDEGVFDRTYEFVQKARLESPYFSILTPYPGTRLYRKLAGEGGSPTTTGRTTTPTMWSTSGGHDRPAALRRVLPAPERGAHRSRHRPALLGNDGPGELLAADELRLPALDQEADRPGAGVSPGRPGLSGRPSGSLTPKDRAMRGRS